MHFPGAFSVVKEKTLLAAELKLREAAASQEREEHERVVAEKKREAQEQDERMKKLKEKAEKLKEALGERDEALGVLEHYIEEQKSKTGILGRYDQ